MMRYGGGLLFLSIIIGLMMFSTMTVEAGYECNRNASLYNTPYLYMEDFDIYEDGERPRTTDGFWTFKQTGTFTGWNVNCFNEALVFNTTSTTTLHTSFFANWTISNVDKGATNYSIMFEFTPSFSENLVGSYGSRMDINLVNSANADTFKLCFNQSSISDEGGICYYNESSSNYDRLEGFGAGHTYKICIFWNENNAEDVRVIVKNGTQSPTTYYAKNLAANSYDLEKVIFKYTPDRDGIHQSNEILDSLKIAEGKNYLILQDPITVERCSSAVIWAKYYRNDWTEITDGTVTFDGSAMIWNAANERYEYTFSDTSDCRWNETHTIHASKTGGDDASGIVDITITQDAQHNFVKITRWWNDLKWVSGVGIDDTTNGDTVYNKWDGKHPFTLYYMSGYGGTESTLIDAHFELGTHSHGHPDMGKYTYSQAKSKAKESRTQLANHFTKASLWDDGDTYISLGYPYNRGSIWKDGGTLKGFYDAGITSGGRATSSLNKWTQYFVDTNNSEGSGAFYGGNDRFNFTDRYDLLNMVRSTIEGTAPQSTKDHTIFVKNNGGAILFYWHQNANYDKTFLNDYVYSDNTNWQAIHSEIRSYIEYKMNTTVIYNSSASTSAKEVYDIHSDVWDYGFWSVPVTFKFYSPKFKSVRILNDDNTVYNDTLANITGVRIMKEGYWHDGTHLYVSTKCDNKHIEINFKPIRPPTNVDAKLEGIQFEDVNITWTLSEDDENVKNYAIYYNTSYNKNGISYSFLADVPAGANYYVHRNAGDGNPNDYFYYVQANDTSGNTDWAGQAGKFVRDLTSGRQLVSIPLVQSDTTLTTVLQTIEGNYNYAQWYDPLDTTDHWRTYSTSKPSGFNDLLNVDHNIALWITMTAKDNLTVAGKVPSSTSIQLHKGWNFVSYASFINRTVSEALSDIWAKVEQVEGFNENAPPYYLRILNDEDIMSCGYGYWVRVTSDCTWTIFN